MTANSQPRQGSVAPQVQALPAELRRFSGTHVALVTPFRKGEVDEESFRRIVRHNVDSGIDGLVPCGTTGEASTLDEAEFRLVITMAHEEANGRVPVIAGTGSNSTRATIARSQLAQTLGADAVLLVAPYYNRPTQEGLLAHFRAVAASIDIPVILYNIPGRSAVNILPDTIEKLVELPNVIGVKEACGDLVQIQQVIAKVNNRAVVLSGDDSLSLPMYAVGGHGVIAVAANLVPGWMGDLFRHYSSGNVAAATALQMKLLPLFRAMGLETNPAPCKAALHAMDLCDEELRLPLVPVTQSTRDAVLRVVRELGLADE